MDDCIVHYNIKEAHNRFLSWWLTRGINFLSWKHVKQIGRFPYYFNVVLPGFDIEWYVIDMVSHNILHNEIDLTEGILLKYVKSYTYKMNH